MSKRITGLDAVRGPREQIAAMDAYVGASGLDHLLIGLVELRVSQINGCAFCLSIHTKALREGGEREDRLAVLPAWRETAWFTPRERAALAWAEAVTTLERQRVPDAVYDQARAEFSERELADLTLAIVAINGWNRFNMALTQRPPVRFDMDAVADAAD
jgi:AhpD family alkylhydroperoxidase